jgi:chitinase
MGDHAISAVTGLHAQLDTLYTSHGTPRTDAALWSMIGTTPMMGQNDTAEIFTFDDAGQVITHADANGLRMIGAWSVNRDHPCWGGLETCTNYSAQTTDYQFTTTFGVFNP